MQEKNNKVAHFCTTLGTFMIGSSSAMIVIFMDLPKMDMICIPGAAIVAGLCIGQIVKSRKLEQKMYQEK